MNSGAPAQRSRLRNVERFSYWRCRGIPKLVEVGVEVPQQLPVAPLATVATGDDQVLGLGLAAHPLAPTGLAPIAKELRAERESASSLPSWSTSPPRRAC